MCFLRPRSSLYACATMPLYITSTPHNKTKEDLTWQVETSSKPKAKSGWKKSMYVHHTFDACVMLCTILNAGPRRNSQQTWFTPVHHPKVSTRKCHKITKKQPSIKHLERLWTSSSQKLKELPNDIILAWWKKYSHVIHHPDTSRTLDPEESLLTIAACILQVLAVIVTPEKDLSLPQKNIVGRIMAHKDMISIEESTSRFEGSITPGAFNLFGSGTGELASRP